MRIIRIYNRKKAIAVLCLVGVLAVAVVGGLVWGGTAVVGAFAAERELPIYGVNRTDNKIAISFDAAWGSEKTEGIMDILEEHGVRATFFLVGFWVDAYPEKTQAIVERGHEIGNHSTDHPEMSKLSEEQIRMELNTTSEKIEALTGMRPVLFRPPFGDYNNRLIRTAKAEGYVPIQWSVDSLDWKNLGVDPLVRRVTENVQSGSIILCHNNSDYILEALPQILDYCQNKGYEFVPISELIYPGECVIDNAGMQQPPEP